MAVAKCAVKVDEPVEVRVRPLFDKRAARMRAHRTFVDVILDTQPREEDGGNGKLRTVCHRVQIRGQLRNPATYTMAGFLLRVCDSEVCWPPQL